MDLFNEAIHNATPYLDRYGYFAVFAGIFLEGIGIPAPGVTLLVAASIAADRGAMSLGGIVGTALVAALLGFNSGYWLGYAGGRGLLRLPHFNQSHFERLHRLFERWGVLVVAVAPFVDGMRQLNGYAAGVAAMPWPRYALANLVGVVFWIAMWSTLGYETARHASAVFRALGTGHPAWYAVAGGVGVALLVYLFWRRRRRLRRPGDPSK